jgi:putative transposase
MKDSEGYGILHPGHRSIRIKGLSYTQPGFYFLTICSEQRKNIFGKIIKGKVSPLPLGFIVQECWLGIPLHFALTKVHDFVVMPNHVHGIIEIVAELGCSSAAPLRPKTPQRAVAAGSIGAMVRSFKAAVTKRARQELNFRSDIWQRNYFERILRDAEEIAKARRYIAENPQHWEIDKENPDAGEGKY